MSIAIAAFLGSAALIWLGCHFGTRWIDRNLRLPAIDPSKPLWKPTPCKHCSDWRLCSECNPY